MDPEHGIVPALAVTDGKVVEYRGAGDPRYHVAHGQFVHPEGCGRVACGPISVLS